MPGDRDPHPLPGQDELEQLLVSTYLDDRSEASSGPDQLRHTFGARMAAADTPLRTIQHWVGHADAKTTQIYAHYQPSATEGDGIDLAFS
jgi:integrase